MAPLSETLAGRYVLQDRIADGGMGAVWRAHDEVLARTVAVKVLHSHLARDEEFLERFRREALAAARLAHPHIVAIYDTGVEPDEAGEDRHFTVMEHCGGGTIAHLLERGGPVAPDEAVTIAVEICDALGYAHRMGVVHRDIKPANVLLCEEGTLKVADFGIAKAAFAADDITTTGSILGTVTYLAPEQVMGLEPDARSDIYSLGILLYELLAGRPPFASESQIATAMKHQRETPAPLRSLRVGVPRALEAVVMRCLAKDPAERYDTAADLRAALERTTARAPGPTAVLHAARAPGPDATDERRSLGPETDGRRGSRRRALLPAAAVVVSVALVAALAVLLPRLLGREEVAGGPGAARRGASQNGARAPVLEVAEVGDFDPHGGDGEHPGEVDLAIDGDRATAWRTSTYEDPLEALGKPGVGLLFDLGESRRVSRMQVVTDTPGYSFEVRAADDVANDETIFDVVEEVDRAARVNVVDLGGSSGRYWLVWITSLPGEGGGSARIAEAKFFGPPGE